MSNGWESFFSDARYYVRRTDTLTGKEKWLACGADPDPAQAKRNEQQALMASEAPLPRRRDRITLAEAIKEYTATLTKKAQKLIGRAELVSEKRLKPLKDEAHELLRIFAAAYKTSRLQIRNQNSEIRN